MFAHGLESSGLIQRITALLARGAIVAGLSLTVSPAALAQKSNEPVLAVTGGRVQGRLLPAQGGAVFKGIPYAAPPIGDLRWREPQPVKPWKGKRQAAEYGADCPQTTGLTGPLLNGTPPRETSENCLFLNVWIPKWPSPVGLPVMVWLHGSELSGGTGALNAGPAEHAETNLVRHGVVLVSINYRPHLLGMMGHPELTAESPHHSSGNYTILDAIAALRWVHDNIARFGGDPGSVTVFGPTGGAVLTSYLVTSPLTKGLIHRAIIESGAPTQGGRPTLSQQQLEHIGVVTAELLKAPSADPVRYLRGLPASDIASASKEMSANRNRYGGYGEGIDGYAIPQSPPEAFRSHEEAHVPVIVGSTAQDSNQIDGVSALKPNASQEEVRAWVENVLQIFYGQYPDLLERAKQIYGLRDGPNEVSTYPPDGPVQEQLGVDLHHRCSVVTTALWHSTISRTFVYEYSRSTPGHPPIHESELRFVFGYLSDDEVADESAHKFADLMQQYWTNFAKNGNPNGPGLPVWPQYDARTKQALDFTKDLPVQRNEYRAAACSPYVDLMNRLPKPLLVK